MGGIRIKAGGWVPMSGNMIDEANGIHGMPLGWIPAGEQTLDGYHALWYGRSREFVDDYARIQRQQCVQQAMLKQLDPATLLSKFEDIANAGTKVVDSNISAGQLGSFVDLAMKAKGKEVSRLTIGPPDFDASFSTVPDFDVIHDKVDSSSQPAPQPQSPAAAPDDASAAVRRRRQPADGSRAGCTRPPTLAVVVVGLHAGDHHARRRTDHRRDAEPAQARGRTSRRSANSWPPTASALPLSTDICYSRKKDTRLCTKSITSSGLRLGIDDGDRRAAGPARIGRAGGRAVDRSPPGLPFRRHPA